MYNFHSKMVNGWKENGNEGECMLTITLKKNIPNIILSLKGELDLSTGDILQQVVDELELEKASTVTFCLNGLRFIDSTGIGQLIGYYKAFAKRNLPVFVENNNEDIEEVLELIGLRELIMPL